MFDAPAQLVRDAKEHGVEVRPFDVNYSDGDCSLESGARGDGYSELRDVWRRAEVTVAALEHSAEGDAWRSMGLGRREAVWAIRGPGDEPLPLFGRLTAAGEG